MEALSIPWDFRVFHLLSLGFAWEMLLSGLLSRYWPTAGSVDPFWWFYYLNSHWSATSVFFTVASFSPSVAWPVGPPLGSYVFSQVVSIGVLLSRLLF